MRIIEVTGVAGVGKSYILDELKQRENVILDTTIVEKFKLNNIYLLALFFKSDNSLKILQLSISIARQLKIPLLSKIKVVGNIVLTIGKNNFLVNRYNEDKIVLVDEGISHFYQNIVVATEQNYKNILEFLNNIISLSNFSNDIILVDASFETIFKRLKNRGHKRLKDEKEIQAFVQKSKEHLVVMKKRFPNIINVNNEKKIEFGGVDV
jgi:dephospho-CoA kinase